MPILTYTPTGADPITWDFAFDGLLGAEVSAIEDATDMYLGDFVSAFYNGSFKVRHVVAWVFMKRTMPTLTLKQFEVRVSELDVDINLADAKRVVELHPDPTDPEVVELIQGYRARFGAALHGDGDGDDPKGPTPSE